MPIVPFLKWAGGKRWLISQDQLNPPPTYQRFIEPFLGGAAIYFQLSPVQSIISDINSDLIEFYSVLRDFPDHLSRMMGTHQQQHTKEYYYIQRATTYDTPLERAARFLYLNRTCWNGLYRVNKKGEFNVPIGTKDKVILDTDDFIGASTVLQNSEIRCSDFENTIDEAGQDDFVFVDPPYTVKHNNNNFIKYNESIFSWADQVRLHNAIIRAANRGAYIVICNADHKSIHDLYDDIGEYKQLSRYSVLAGKADKRKKTTEAMYRINFTQ
ncbi:Dam family site-specific DNA-(adenine-N6)-methyltransferase [Desulfovibrio sp. JC010]|uniref:DNA adenine methylase n=1 Tax=Desulfovibrio sp. JC010 TaxID=2593641 RepID=UPI0013CF6A91|nr:Dam family site-specific DNA-(adenine-N6)-methyltransferase [Desulfovibrio sp. JC010]NDV28145.1 Dam family site-specific DNA-(adenine-N6)-methyltransferase [Desulfovibrio sp. JC010]